MKATKQVRQIKQVVVLAELKNRQTARFITESNVSSSSKQCQMTGTNANTTASLETSRQVKNCLLNLAYIFRKRLANSFRKMHMLSLESSSSLGQRRRPRHKKNFSEIQFVCCASIFDVITIKVQKNMVRAFFKMKSHVGIEQYCELDVMRRVRILSSKNVSSNYIAVDNLGRQSHQQSQCTFSFNMQELLLERVQYLNAAMEEYEHRLIRCAFSMIKFTAIRHAEMRATRRIVRRKNDMKYENTFKMSLPLTPNGSMPVSPLRIANNSPPKPNRITKNFQIQITPRRAEQTRSKSKGRQILNRMEEIIDQLDKEISKSKSPTVRRDNRLTESVRISHVRNVDTPGANTSRTHFRKKNPFLDGSSEEDNSNFDDSSDIRKHESKLNDERHTKSSKGFLRNQKVEQYKQSHSMIAKDYVSPEQSHLESQYIEAPQFERHQSKIMAYPQMYQQFGGPPPSYPVYPPMYPFFAPPNQDGRFFYPQFNGYVPYPPYANPYEQARFSSMTTPQDSMRKESSKVKQGNRSMDNESFGEQSFPQGFSNQPFISQQYQSQQIPAQPFSQQFPTQAFQPQQFHQAYPQPYPYKYK